LRSAALAVFRAVNPSNTIVTTNCFIPALLRGCVALFL
jgi:hypothetical protein